MSIMIQCPHCSSQLRCKDKLAGQQVPCLKCNALLTIPEVPSQVKINTAPDPLDAPWKPPLWDSEFSSEPIKDSSTNKGSSQRESGNDSTGSNIATSVTLSLFHQTVPLFTVIAILGTILAFFLTFFLDD